MKAPTNEKLLSRPSFHSTACVRCVDIYCTAYIRLFPFLVFDALDKIMANIDFQCFHGTSLGRPSRPHREPNANRVWEFARTIHERRVRDLPSYRGLFEGLDVSYFPKKKKKKKKKTEEKKLIPVWNVIPFSAFQS
jgi:hypothetical protein